MKSLATHHMLVTSYLRALAGLQMLVPIEVSEMGADASRLAELLPAPSAGFVPA